MSEGGGDYDQRCGSCAAFMRVYEDAELGRVGSCALEVYPAPVRASATCTRYRPKGAAAAAERPRAAGEPRRYRASTSSTTTVRRSRTDEPHLGLRQAYAPVHLGLRQAYAPVHPGLRQAYAPQIQRELPKEIDIDMDIDEFRSVLREVISEELGVSKVAMGRRWEGGELVLQPGSTDTQEKRVPIESFFHKIVMIRDKLRVLEAKVNSSAMSDEEKVQLQSYITACYGTLTTFNVLFADSKRDGFNTKR
jgi:hypothetical protein